MDEDGRLTKNTLKFLSGEFDVQSIHTLCLSKLGLNDISALSECICIERLDLSFNDVTRLHALSPLVNVRVLDLSANSITTLDGLQSLENLEKLNLSGNLIGSCDSLRCLSKLEKLRDLRLREPSDRNLSNPVCMNVTYKRDVLCILSQLKVLDGEWLVGVGGELFRLLEEVDRSLTDFHSNPPDGPFKPATMPQPLPSPQDGRQRTDTTYVEDMERQFQESLAHCAKLEEQSRVLLCSINDKLHGKRTA